MTYKSDILIPQSLKEELIACVKPLEDVPENLKDWHPHSNNQVLDLVHPSLYPVVFGKTRLYKIKSLVPCLPHVGGGDRVADASVVRGRYRNCIEEKDVLSSRFQWLPTDFSINPATKEVKFEGYINNLHPVQHKQLYFVLEKLMSVCLPMFDRVLFDMRHPPTQRAICNTAGWYIEGEGEEKSEGEESARGSDEGQEEVESEGEVSVGDYGEEEVESEGEEGVGGDEGQEEEGEESEGEESVGEDEGQEEEEEGSSGEEGVGGDDEEDQDEYDDYWDKRNLSIPDAKVFERPNIDFTTHNSEDVEMKNEDENTTARKKITLSDFGHGQVIVKLGNIELTPENPEYPGGSWHLEGMLVCLSLFQRVWDVHLAEYRMRESLLRLFTTMIRKISRTIIWLSDSRSGHWTIMSKMTHVGF